MAHGPDPDTDCRLRYEQVGPERWLEVGCGASRRLVAARATGRRLLSHMARLHHRLRLPRLALSLVLRVVLALPVTTAAAAPDAQINQACRAAIAEGLWVQGSDSAAADTLCEQIVADPTANPSTAALTLFIRHMRDGIGYGSTRSLQAAKVFGDCLASGSVNPGGDVNGVVDLINGCNRQAETDVGNSWADNMAATVRAALANQPGIGGAQADAAARAYGQCLKEQLQAGQAILSLTRDVCATITNPTVFFMAPAASDCQDPAQTPLDLSARAGPGAAQAPAGPVEPEDAVRVCLVQGGFAAPAANDRAAGPPRRPARGAAAQADASTEATGESRHRG